MDTNDIKPENICKKKRFATISKSDRDEVMEGRNCLPSYRNFLREYLQEKEMPDFYSIPDCDLPAILEAFLP